MVEIWDVRKAKFRSQSRKCNCKGLLRELHLKFNASVSKMANEADSKSAAEKLSGSSPDTGTILKGE